jgi:hypothetical protein
MGEAQRRKVQALKAGKPWPPTEKEAKPRPRKTFICGACSFKTTQQDMPVLACRCGQMQWNTIERSR